ncbi:hypothetical protein V7139_28815 [Neobacillus drentensis]
MLLRLYAFWDWFWYHRRGKIKYRVWGFGIEFRAYASNGNLTIWNCYGSTPEAAKEMALFRFKLALSEDPKEQELIHRGDGFALFREK